MKTAEFMDCSPGNPNQSMKKGLIMDRPGKSPTQSTKRAEIVDRTNYNDLSKGIAATDISVQSIKTDSQGLILIL